MSQQPLDLVVHKRNAKGKIVRKNPYRLIVKQGVQIFEIPADSGNYFLADGTPTTENPLPMQKNDKRNEELQKQNAELQAKLDKLQAKADAEAMMAKEDAAVTQAKPVDSQAQKKS